MELQRSVNANETSAHRVVVCLEELAQSMGGFWVHSKPTEEVNKILVAHAGLDQLKCTLLQRRVHSIGQTATCVPVLSATVGRITTSMRTWQQP